MFCSASSSVAPCDQQPGKPGTETLYPSAVLRSAILYLMTTFEPLQRVCHCPAVELSYGSSPTTQCPRAWIVSYLVSGARSAPVGHTTAPSCTLTCRKTFGSRSGSKTVPFTCGLSRNR